MKKKSAKGKAGAKKETAADKFFRGLKELMVAEGIDYVDAPRVTIFTKEGEFGCDDVYYLAGDDTKAERYALRYYKKALRQI